MEINVPTSLKDISLRQYKEYVRLPEDLNEVAHMDQAIRIFCSIGQNEVNRLPLKSRKKIANMITQAVSEKPSKVILRTKLNGIELGFHNDLDEMTLGEYVDVEMSQNDEQLWDKAMRVLYRPISKDKGKRYAILPYVEALQVDLDYDDMTMDVVFSSMVFFCDLGIDLLVVMMKSLMAVEEVPTGNNNSPKNGDGTDQLLPLLTATYYELKKLRDSMYIKPLCT